MESLRLLVDRYVLETVLCPAQSGWASSTDCYADHLKSTIP